MGTGRNVVYKVSPEGNPDTDFEGLLQDSVIAKLRGGPAYRMRMVRDVASQDSLFIDWLTRIGKKKGSSAALTTILQTILKERFPKVKEVGFTPSSELNPFSANKRHQTTSEPKLAGIRQNYFLSLIKKLGLRATGDAFRRRPRW